jgi:hypothetical protein
MMVTVSLDSPSCEVTLLILCLVVYRYITRQAKGLYRLKHVGALKNGLTYLSLYNSGWFCHMKDGEERAELMPLTHKFAKRCCVRIFCNERTRSNPLDPKLMFGVFRTILLLHERWCRMGRTSAISTQVRYIKLRWNFFATNAPDPLHWTQNSCLGAYRTVP